MPSVKVREVEEQRGRVARELHDDRFNGQPAPECPPKESTPEERGGVSTHATEGAGCGKVLAE